MFEDPTKLLARARPTEIVDAQGGVNDLPIFAQLVECVAVLKID
jgi:hypothetical protein